MGRPRRTLTPAIEEVFGKTSPYSVRLEAAYAAEGGEWKQAERPFLRIIRCQRGGKISGERANIFPHSGSHLGFIGTGVGLRRELLAIAGVVAHQTGDQEFSVIFPTELLGKVAEVVRPVRKRGRVRGLGDQGVYFPDRSPKSAPNSQKVGLDDRRHSHLNLTPENRI